MDDIKKLYQITFLREFSCFISPKVAQGFIHKIFTGNALFFLIPFI